MRRKRQGDVSLISQRSYLEDFRKLYRVSYPEKDIMSSFGCPLASIASLCILMNIEMPFQCFLGTI